MNAYELAKYLATESPEAISYRFACGNAAIMLRQQADRIAELEKTFVQARVANFIEGEYGQTITHPHKELSDEEIRDIWYQHEKWLATVPYSFARAIIKASRGEE